MSCVGSIAKGVGRERFQPIFEQFLKFAMDNLKTDDPTLRCVRRGVSCYRMRFRTSMLEFASSSVVKC